LLGKHTECLQNNELSKSISKELVRRGKSLRFNTAPVSLLNKQ